jgi:hypothetical protein
MIAGSKEPAYSYETLINRDTSGQSANRCEFVVERVARLMV